MASAFLNLEQIITCDVGQFLEPRSLTRLSAVDTCLNSQLQLSDVQGILQTQVTQRLAAAPCMELGQQTGTESCLMPMISLASTIEVVVQCVNDCMEYPRAAGDKLLPLSEAIAALHNLAMQDCELKPMSNRCKRSPLSKHLLKYFANLSGLLPCLVKMLRKFTNHGLPVDVFVKSCDVLTRLLSKQDSKREFITGGGLAPLIAFMYRNPCEQAVQASGLGTLVALSARSPPCILLMVQKNVLKVVTQSLQYFPDNAEVVCRAIGLLANLANVRELCPLLEKHGFAPLIQTFRGGEEISKVMVMNVLARAEEQGAQ